MRIILFLALAAGLMPLSGLFPFAYPLLLLAPRSRTLWLPIGLHLGWNVSDQTTSLAGAPFLLGYGVAMAALLIAIAILLTAPRARPLPVASP